MLYPYIAVVRLQRSNRWFAGRIQTPAPLHFGHSVELGIPGAPDHPAVRDIHNLGPLRPGPVGVVLFGLGSLPEEEEAVWLSALEKSVFTQELYQQIKGRLPKSWSLW